MAISGRIFRRPIRNGAAPPRPSSWRSLSIGCASAAAASPISTSPSCAKRPASDRTAMPCARVSPRLPASASIASPSRRPRMRSLASSAAGKALPPLRPRRSGCRQEHNDCRSTMIGAMIDDAIRDAAARVLDACRTRGLILATAESCTGGLVAGALTEIPGSSDVLDRGFVTYSNAAKETMLGVPASILERHGAVSRETADAMAAGALAMSNADLAIAITGIAGPGGGSAEKPVGLVHFAAAARDGRHVHREKRYGDVGRSAVRREAVAEALALLEMLASGARI